MGWSQGMMKVVVKQRNEAMRKEEKLHCLQRKQGHREKW